jgi:putative hydrolase of the HAD superfamily
VNVRGIAFDVNGTLVDIQTDDGSEQVFRAAGHFLTYQGVDLRRHQIRDLYFQILKEQQKASHEEYPEFDAVGIWRQIINDHMSDFTRSLPTEKLTQMPLFLAEMSRGISRHRLRLYPHVREVIDTLGQRFPLALVTDAQSAFARAELHKVGLLEYFNPIIVSGEVGYRKPDSRLFQMAADGMGVPSEMIVYIGNDMQRDIYGAREVGMTTVMFDSDQGTKEYLDCQPDYTITDLRQLLEIVDLPLSPRH